MESNKERWTFWDYAKLGLVGYMSTMFGPVALNLLFPFGLYGRPAEILAKVVIRTWELLIAILGIVLVAMSLFGMDATVTVHQKNVDNSVIASDNTGEDMLGTVTPEMTEGFKEFNVKSLFSAFRENKIALEKEHGDSRIKVTGTVREFEIQGSGYGVYLGNNRDKLKCFFNKETIETLSALKVGDEVELVGVLRVHNDGLNLTDCNVVVKADEQQKQ